MIVIWKIPNSVKAKYNKIVNTEITQFFEYCNDYRGKCLKW